MSLRLVSVFLAGCLSQALADANAAASYSAAHGEWALLVHERGNTVLERGPALSRAAHVFSITKSLFSIGVFRAALRGGASPSSLVSRGPARGISFGDLMNQTSGLDPMSARFYSEGLQDKGGVFAEMKPPQPSRGFAYGASHWEVLANEIAPASGNSLESWLMKFLPGARPHILARWRRDGKGRLFVSTGARMSARELLPAARAVLAGLGTGFGKWPASVREIFSTGTPQNGMYALGFWLNRNAVSPGAHEVDVEDSLAPPPSAAFWRHGCLSRGAPADLVAMIGSGGQRVYVVPSRGLVMIRLAKGGGFSDAEFLGRYFAPPSKARRAPASGS